MKKNENCFILRNLGVKVYPRCDYCNLELHKCLGMQTNIISFFLIMFVVLLVIIENPLVVKISAVSIIFLVVAQSMLINKKTNELIFSQYSVEERTRELRRANELKDLFSDIMRHDLQNPLTVIEGLATLMEEEESQPKRRRDLRMIKRNVAKMMGLIDASSKLSRLASVEKLDFEEQDINAIFRDVVKDFEPLLKKRGINVVYRAEGERLANVHAMIEEVFANLLSNAIKYSPPKSKVIIDILDEGDAWKVMVADQGEGVPDEYKETIFDRFERGDKKGVKGTGLGLAIVKRIVELHRGKTWVENNPGEGSKFYVVIPKNGREEN
jgi:signal transduction histidine kinase